MYYSVHEIPECNRIQEENSNVSSKMHKLKASYIVYRGEGRDVSRGGDKNWAACKRNRSAFQADRKTDPVWRHAMRSFSGHVHMYEVIHSTFMCQCLRYIVYVSGSQIEL